MKKLLLTAACAFASCVGVEAQSVIGYNFGMDANPSSGTQTNFTAGMLSVGNQTGTTTGVSATSPSSGYTIPAADGGGNASGGNNFSNNVVGGAFSLTTSSYDQVTFTPSAGYRVEITNFDFANRSTSSGPGAFTLRSSADNYAADIVTGTFTANSNYVFKDNTDFTLFGAADTALTLRLYLSGGSSTATGNDRIDDIFITATAVLDAALPVPEPASVVTLLGGGLLVGAICRKKRCG